VGIKKLLLPIHTMVCDNTNPRPNLCLCTMHITLCHLPCYCDHVSGLRRHSSVLAMVQLQMDGIRGVYLRSPLTECINVSCRITCMQDARRQHVFYVDFMGLFVLVYRINECVAADAAHTTCKTH